MWALMTLNLKIRAYDKQIARLAERPEFKAQNALRHRVVFDILLPVWWIGKSPSLQQTDSPCGMVALRCDRKRESRSVVTLRWGETSGRVEVR